MLSFGRTRMRHRPHRAGISGSRHWSSFGRRRDREPAHSSVGHHGKLTTLVTAWLEFTAAPASLTTWSLLPNAFKNTDRRSWSLTPAVTGTSNACAAWMSGPTLKNE